MNSQRKAGAILGYINILAKNLVNLVYTPMLLSFVGQGDYGVYQTCNSFVFSLTLLSAGFSQAYVRFFTQRKVKGLQREIRSLNTVFVLFYSVVSVVALLLGVALSVNVEILFSSSFSPSQLELARALILIMSVNIAVTLFSTVFDAYIIANEQFTYRQSRQIFTTLMTPAVAYSFLCLGFEAVGVALAQLIIVLLLLSMNAFYSFKRLKMRLSTGGIDRGLFGSILSFSFWIFANQACDLVNQSVPNILLGALTSAVTVSVFAVSVQIRNVFVSLSTVMSSVFVPKINQIVASTDDNAKLTLLMTRVGRYQMLLFCWVYGGFVLLGRFFISKWAGSHFSDAYLLICLMALPLGVPLCQNLGIEIQRAKNKHHARSIVYLLMAILNIAFTLVASPYIGYWAPAIGYIVSIVLGNGVFMNWYYHFRVGLNMRYYWERNLPVVLCATAVLSVCMVGVVLFPVNGWISFLSWGALYTVAYVAAMWVSALGPDERILIRKRFKSLGRKAVEDDE